MADNEFSRSDRVSISDSAIVIYKELTEGSNIEDVPFRTLKEVFMLAVCVGYQMGQRQALPPGSKHTIRREVFTESDYTVLRAIALAATDDIEVLMRPHEVLTIAEEYAQTGIQYVKTHLLSTGGRPLWHLVQILTTVRV